MPLLQRAEHLDVDFGSIEGAITVVVGPWLSKVVQCLLEGCLSLVPELVRTETILWARRQLKLVLEPEETVDVLEEIERLLDLLGQLVLSTENVSIVLLEATNSDQTIQSSGNLVSVQRSEVSILEG